LSLREFNPVADRAQYCDHLGHQFYQIFSLASNFPCFSLIEIFLLAIKLFEKSRAS